VFRRLWEPRSEQAGVERTLRPTNRGAMARLDDQPNVFDVGQHITHCYGIGETPAPNRQGAVVNTVCSLHGNDIDSDGACVTGPQPYTREKGRPPPVCRRFPLSAGWNRNGLVRETGHPVAGCHGLKAVEEVTYTPSPFSENCPKIRSPSVAIALKETDIEACCRQDIHHSDSLCRPLLPKVAL
jgi:hypothetical protein